MAKHEQPPPTTPWTTPGQLLSMLGYAPSQDGPFARIIAADPVTGNLLIERVLPPGVDYGFTPSWLGERSVLTPPGYGGWWPVDGQGRAMGAGDGSEGVQAPETRHEGIREAETPATRPCIGVEPGRPCPRNAGATYPELRCCACDLEFRHLRDAERAMAVAQSLERIANEVTAWRPTQTIAPGPQGMLSPDRLG